MGRVPSWRELHPARDWWARQGDSPCAPLCDPPREVRWPQPLCLFPSLRLPQTEIDLLVRPFLALTVLSGTLRVMRYPQYDLFDVFNMPPHSQLGRFTVVALERS